MIFENQFTLYKSQFLQSFTKKILYDDKNKKFIEHSHVIYISNFSINQIKKSLHIYIDGTFIVPPEFKQVLIILYYDHDINKKIPAAYILLNNKREKSYYIALKDFYNIITVNRNIKLSLISYTVDFEEALINATKKIFVKDIRAVGCLFHYGQAIFRNMKNVGLYNKKNKEYYFDLYTDIIKLPWLYDNHINTFILKNTRTKKI